MRCYKVIGVNNTTGSGMSKTAVIPRNGFVIADCYSSSFGDLVNVKVGDVAYLYMEGVKKVTFGGKGAGTPYTPEKCLPEIESNLTHLGTTPATEQGFTVKIDNFDKDADYYIAVNDSSVCDDGVIKLGKTKITSESYTLPKHIFGGKGMLTVSLWAEKNGVYSPITRTSMIVFEQSALLSQLSQKKIVAFGDSLTAFTGWVKGMHRVVGTDVINSGVGGDTSAMGKARFKRDVLDKDPDICIINFGMNDQATVVSTGKPNASLESYTSNIRYFITELQKIDCHVVLVTPHTPYEATNYYTPGQYGLNYAGEHMDSFCDAVRSLASEYGCTLVDINKLSANEDKARFVMMYDGLHCSEYGHEMYKKWISEALLAEYAFAGDMNGDGSIDEKDVELVKDAMGDTADENCPADFDRDGMIDVNDYLTLLRYVSENGDLKWMK